MTGILNKATLLRLAPLGIIILLVCLFFYKVTILGEIFYWRDIFAHSYPAKKLFALAVISGEFPLWNPYIQTGIPYLADLSNQALYFTNMLFVILPDQTALNISILISYFLAGLFSYLLVRSLTNNEFISIYTGIAYPLCGYCVSLSCNLEYLSAIPWVPAVFWAYYEIFKTGKTIYIFLASAFLSMLIFAGDPMSFYFTALFLLLFSLFQLKSSVQPRFIFVFSLLILLLSLGLSAIQLLPSFELSSLSTRAEGLTFKEATVWSTHPVRYIELLFPGYFGHHFSYPAYWGNFMFKDYFSDLPWAESIYIGIIPLIMAVYAFLNDQKIDKYYWLLITIVSIVLSFGHYGLFYKVCFNILPGLDKFRYPEKLLLFVSLGIIVLSAYGLKDLINQNFKLPKNCKAYLLFPASILLFVFLFDFSSIIPLSEMQTTGAVNTAFINMNFNINITYFLIILTTMVTGTIILQKSKQYNKLLIFVIALCFIDIFLINSKAYDTTKINFFNQSNKYASAILNDWKYLYPPRLMTKIFPDDKLSKENLEYYSKKDDPAFFLNNFYAFIFKYYLKNLKPNRSNLYQIATIYTVSPLKLKKVETLINYYRQRKPLIMPESLDIRYIMLKPDLSGMYTKDNAFKQLIKNDPFDEMLLVLEKPSNRAFITNNYKYFNNSEEVKKAITEEDFDTSKNVALVWKHPDKGAKKLLSTESSVVLNSYRFNSIELETSTENEAFLVILDSYYPGWKAYIENKEIEIIEANYIFKALKIPAGSHKIKLTFDPNNFKAGIAVSLITLLILIFFIIRVKKLPFITSKNNGFDDLSSRNS